MLEYDIKTQKEGDIQPIIFSKEIETILTSKINECFNNEKFKELPIQIIYRIVEKSPPNELNSNKLFDVIVKSLSKFCVLFPFLDLQKLSDDRLEELCKMYSKSNENTRQYFNYLKCNLNLIDEINSRKKNLQEMKDEQRNIMKNLEEKITSLQNQFNNSEKANTQLQDQLNDSNNLINEQQSKMSDLEESLQKHFNDSEKINQQLQSQINYSKDLENQISQLQKQLNKLFMIKGQIVASVEKGCIIKSEINLKTKNSALDTSKSKIIVSTSGVKCLGSEAYEKGDPITSLHTKSSFIRKPGTYYVRCIIFNCDGESNEFVSNPVITSVSSIKFDYEGRKPSQVLLPKGKYKLEVWGAKGGNSTGDCHYNRKSSIVKGGLGGYSCGTLSLNQDETVFVYVGGEGITSNVADGSSASGGFPEGGGAKTGHNTYSNIKHTTVPGSGGGSTSIRIGSDTNYARVIVAGGGGGAGGSFSDEDPGGFGGGISGGNCFYDSSLKSQGAGTQTGSTSGLGEGSDRDGDPGQFGLGATGKYNQGCDSGGGGGGGWYGGGGGGFGNLNHCSSGGGGSGWVFTETSFNEWRSKDTENASKFALNSTYYLTDARCVGGDEEFPNPTGNGTEKGHSGNGFAKITLL